MKRILVLLTLLLLFGSFACQPTPEQDIVHSQAEDYLRDLQSVSEHEKIQAPDTLDGTTVSKTGNLTIQFEAAVQVPDAAAYSVYEVAPRNFSDELFLSMVEVFCPGAALIGEPVYTKMQWAQRIHDYQEQIGDKQATTADKNWLEYANAQLEAAPVSYTPPAFSLADIRDGQFFRAHADNHDGSYTLFAANRNGNDFYYGRDAELAFFSENQLSAEFAEDRVLLKDFAGEFDFRREDALGLAESILNELYLTDLQLVDTQKLCTYQNNKLYSKGWYFTFTHGMNGLPTLFHFDTFSSGGYTAPPPTLCSPWGEEAVLIAIDAQGLINIEIRNLIQYKAELVQNIALLPFEQVKERIEAYLMLSNVYAAENIDDSVIVITHIELCAALVNVKDNPWVGRLIPAWFVRYEYRGSNMNAYTDDDGNFHAATTFVDRNSRYFSAIDGSYIEPRIMRDMIEGL